MNKIKVENSNILNSLNTCPAGPERTRHLFSLNFGSCVGDFRVVYDFNPCDTLETSPSRLTVVLGDNALDTGFIGNSFFNEQLNDLGFPNVSAGIGLVKGSLIVTRGPNDPEIGKVIIDTPFQSSSVEFYLECPENCNNSDSDSDSDSDLGFNSANYLGWIVPPGVAPYSLCDAGWTNLHVLSNGTVLNDVTTVGTNGGPSAYGTYDQNGNTDEWILVRFGNLPNSKWTGSGVHIIGGGLRIDSIGSSYEWSHRSIYCGFRISSPSTHTDTFGIPFVEVGDVNNDPEVNIAYGSRDVGKVRYEFKISKYPVTCINYVEFLNAIAKTDTHELYDQRMSSPFFSTYATPPAPYPGPIIRTGSNGSYSYSLRDSIWANKPITCVSYLDAMRYCNWLHNGKPEGLQDSSTTEDGAYFINGVKNSNYITGTFLNTYPKPGDGENPDPELEVVLGAKYYIPTIHEWWKAAYYKSGSTSAGYWNYATQSDDAPSCITADAQGNGPFPIPSDLEN
jgi:hypothetical protein